MIENTLKTYFGYSTFRPGQRQLIESIKSGRDVLGVLPTGGGKSLCYQLPAIEFQGLTLVVSPLISLMKDQVDQAREMGIKAAFLNSTLSQEETDEVYSNILNGEIKILYIAPERLDSSYFVDIFKDKYISFLAIDEAHCISQWGHDFRPSYRKIRQFIDRLERRPVIGAFTATATKKVRQDIIDELALENPYVRINSFDRPNIRFSIKYGVNVKEEILKDINKEDPTIIYCSTRKKVDSLSSFLVEKGYRALPYHAGMDSDKRSKTQDDFIKDRVNIIVATNAFGMGINKADVRKVIHANMPKSLESYYQEAGRAGRDSDKAQAILYYNQSDLAFARRLIAMGKDPNAQAKLNAMVAYTNETKCLRSFILNYFGEKSEPCNNCSACLEKPASEDMTVQGKMILSCLYRMGQGYGMDLLARVLKGENSEKVRDKGFENLSTFGLMKETSLSRIKDMINYLVALDYMTIGTYQRLYLNKKSRNLLLGGDQVFIRAEEEYKVRKPSDSSKTKKFSMRESYDEEIVNKDLYEKLIELRNEIAREIDLPSYIIFNNSSLRSMARTLPTTKQELIQVQGVGYKKLNSYGDRFLEVINQYIDLNPRLKRREKKTTKGRDENLPLSSNQKRTYELYKESLDYKEIANETGFRRSTILKHLIALADKGYDIEFESDLSSYKKDKIIQAIEKVGYQKLKPLKGELGPDFSYKEIKFAVLEYLIERNNNPSAEEKMKNYKAYDQDDSYRDREADLIDEISKSSLYSWKEIYKLLNKRFGSDDQAREEFLTTIDMKKASDIIGDLLKEEEEAFKITF